MSLIEGVGDEVVEFFIGLLVITIGLAAWWSTRIVDRPLIRTVLVFERRSQNQISQLNASQSTSDELRAETEPRNYVQDLPAENSETEQEANKPPTPGSSLGPGSHRLRLDAGDASQEDSSTTEDEQSVIVESMDSSDACALRRRRLEFFQGRQDTLISGPVDSDLNRNETGEDNLDEMVLDNDNDNSSQETTETIVDEDEIRIKLKYINDDLKLVNGKLREPLGDFKRRHFEFEMANDKLVRLIFNGQVLQRDDMTLQGCGMFDNCVVHCLVHQKRGGASERSTGTGLGAGNGVGSTPTNSNAGRSRGLGNSQSASQQQPRDWDLGNLFFAIISFVLGAAWYFRYEYAQLYTVTATVALVGLTGIFTVLLVGMYFPDPEPPVQPVRS